MILIRVFILTAFVTIFFVSLFKLKPLRFHKVYKYSTFFLKTSFLVYLIPAMWLLYMFMFYTNRTLYFSPEEFSLNTTHPLIFLIILGFILPPAGIFARRKIKNRKPYNILFTAINTGYIIFFVLILLFSQWQQDGYLLQE